MSEWVLLVHGNLLTKERLDSVKISCQIEATPKLWFQFVVFLPGVFHFEMACADAIWHIWIQPTEGCHDPNSMFHHISILRPKETGKMGTKLGDQQMHHVIQHNVSAAILDCWTQKAYKQNLKWSSLEEFGREEPSWDLIEKMSYSIVENYVGTVKRISEMREGSAEGRDAIFENQIMQNHDELLYLDLIHAVRAGNVGQIEEFSFSLDIYVQSMWKTQVHVPHTSISLQFDRFISSRVGISFFSYCI